MSKQLLMGNEAIAYGAIDAGVSVVTGYPGTPSSEILETVAKRNVEGIYVEWSTNEKSALEVAAGASYTGARVMVTMKQVGLNVASDPLMSLRYVGIKGGMVIVAADDPGPISSQTEQDTRHFGQFSKLPVFDPSTPEEAYSMISDAFDYSEKYHTPVLFRPTTRVCHSYSSIEIKAERKQITPEGFIKDSKWVIFPKLALNNHIKLEKELIEMGDEFSSYPLNRVFGNSTKGIATGGVSYEYVMESNPDAKIFKVSTPNPFPEKLAIEFLNGLDEVMVIEELDPVIENALIRVCGKYNLTVKIRGKGTGDMPCAGENTVNAVSDTVNKFLGNSTVPHDTVVLPNLPIRPPVLCAGCPHRASFYAVKVASKGKKPVFCGDIGCYTLGNAMPLDMVDTCLCMGGGITVAQGISRVEPDTKAFAFVGDSTFFHTGIAGIINAVYNKANLTVIIVDNSTTAMTGGQEHPGTGKTMMGNITDKISIAEVLKGIGVNTIKTVDPLDLSNAVSAVKDIIDIDGVNAIIFKSPCISLFKSTKKMSINEKCTGCKMCIKEIGCPALSLRDGKAVVDKTLCNGCGLCSCICKFGAIQKCNNVGGAV